jgi:hypothetical protein
MVRVMCLADLFPYLTAVSLVHHIYIHLVSRTEERESSLYSLRCNSLIIVKIADWCPWFFPRKNRVSCSILFSHYLLTLLIIF